MSLIPRGTQELFLAVATGCIGAVVAAHVVLLECPAGSITGFDESVVLPRGRIKAGYR